MLNAYQKKYSKRAGQREIPRHRCTTLRCCKCWVVIRKNILNVWGSVESTGIAAGLHWVSYLLDYFRKEAIVTQYTPGCLAKRLSEKTLRRADSLEIFKRHWRIDSVTCLLNHFGKEITMTFFLVVFSLRRTRSFKFLISCCPFLNLCRRKRYGWLALNSVDFIAFFWILCSSCRKASDIDWRRAMPGHVANFELRIRPAIFFEVGLEKYIFCSRKDWRKHITMS